MSVIDKKQGAIKLSEIATDTAQPNIGTAIGEDALSVVAQIQQLALDSFLKQGIQSFSTGRLKWDGAQISFNEDSRNNNLYFRALQTDDATVRTVDIVMVAAGANSNTAFSTIPIAAGELIYIELSKAQLIGAPGGVLNIDNAVSGSSLATGHTLRKISLTQTTGMPQLTSLLTGNGSSLFIPVAFRYDWTDGVNNFQDLMWVMPGERWEIDTSTYIGTSVAKSSGGAILNFIETSGIGWDAEVGAAGINTYNDASPIPVDGSGGVVSPNFTFGVTNNPAEILSGKASFFIEKTGAVNLQGHGISFDIKIDKGYRSRYVVFKALYSIVSGLFNPGDITGFVIADPTGTPQLLTVANAQIGAGIGEMNATFYPLLNVDTYRVCFHLTSSSANNFRLILDDLKINPVFFVTADAFGAVTPAGAIASYGGTGDPDGWMICDGRSLNRLAYPQLFSAIGTAFGTASPTTFNLPDLRGNFARGVDAGAGTDPDTGSRSASQPGGNVGNAVGSLQGFQIQSHAHAIRLHGNAGLNGVGSFFVDTGVNGSTFATGGNETRPRNVYVNFIIKLVNDVKNTVLAQANVSYASNSNGSATVSDTASFSGRMEGELFPSLAIGPTNATRRVQFNQVVAPTDHLKLQVDFGSGGKVWADAHSRFARTDVPSMAVISSATLASPNLVLQSVAGLYKGMAVTGTGFAPGTTILSVDIPNSQLILSANASVASIDEVYFFTPYAFGLWLEPVGGNFAQLDIHFGAGGANQDGQPWTNYAGWRYRVVKASNDLAIQAQIKDEPGTIKMFGGVTAPNGWLPADGRSLLRSAYPDLYIAIGTRWGARNANEFNLPDSRGVFFRGETGVLAPQVNFTAVNASTDTILAPAHGLNRTGLPVILSSTGSAPGNLGIGGVYWVIIVDDNNFKLASSQALALANSPIDITSQGTGDHTFTQYIDPDRASRVAESVGGSPVMQDDQFESHDHNIKGGFKAPEIGSLESFNLVADTGANRNTVPFPTGSDKHMGGSETRPVNVSVLFMIKT